MAMGAPRSRATWRSCARPSLSLSAAGYSAESRDTRQRSWAERTAYNRGQIIYRVAEVLEGRAGQLAAELEAVGVDPDAARADVEAAVDAAVYWAGFADKLDQLAGGVNPVAGPFLNLSETVPLGVCAPACPDDGGVRGVLRLVCPAIMAGNAVVALAGGEEAVVKLLGQLVDRPGQVGVLDQ